MHKKSNMNKERVIVDISHDLSELFNSIDPYHSFDFEDKNYILLKYINHKTNLHCKSESYKKWIFQKLIDKIYMEMSIDGLETDEEYLFKEIYKMEAILVNNKWWLKLIRSDLNDLLFPREIKIGEKIYKYISSQNYFNYCIFIVTDGIKKYMCKAFYKDENQYIESTNDAFLPIISISSLFEIKIILTNIYELIQLNKTKVIDIISIIDSAKKHCILQNYSINIKMRELVIYNNNLYIHFYEINKYDKYSEKEMQKHLINELRIYFPNFKI